MREQTKTARLRQIIKILNHYHVVKNITQQKNPADVRSAFEELGPTFIKVGQMMSVRTDIFTLAFTKELRNLQDDVKTDSFASVKALVEKELGLPLTEIFDSFDEQPFASASIAQAHHARLKNGQSVVAKVQHPGIAAEIELDLSLFEKAIPLASWVPESNVIDLKHILKEIRESLQNELDFQKELLLAEKFYRLNDGWKEIRVPKMEAAYSTKKVIIMDLMPGTNLKELISAPDDTLVQEKLTYKELKKTVSELLIEHFMKEVFEDGFFHADPHPGNILLQLLNDEENQQTAPINRTKHQGTIGHVPYTINYTKKTALRPFRLNFIDFGMMGTLNREMQAKMSNVIIAIYSKDNQRITNAVHAICKQVGSFDEEKFTDELDDFLNRYLNLPVKEIDLQKVFSQVVVICHDNNLQIDDSATMLIKAFGTLEGVIEDLNPDLSLFEVIAPFAQKYFIQQLNLKDELQETGLDYLSTLKALPKIPSHALNVLDTFAKGKGKLNLELKNQRTLLERAEAMVNRLVIGLILSALVIGSSILVQTSPKGHTLISNLGIFGYSVAALSILFLILESLYRRYRKWKDR
ncbi:AarF/UbiB family protein [Enterococcus dongliensis]|uniref:AarF/UbiB family protein n=1 Tax=Enterococcus dongliensis TaxID=2559925 RepID=A0AAP5KP26_9ENTE|nr:AarF/UbiB family protein [Enterococcus dongliensis]MDT2595459.1 AarF/UbiB family protein [Enterococcus dongliensis]MDT2603327.1 AarF/UbiB family protein [Enterococcus dongliensis]MDT2612700.1 AarF/UbiB family protein [Enterococcus dongliensis]MDT2633688.1 AarF/UbiB family protein [Enterococcus dongliensis]MDT2635938.1 AarF/UbiB family protein [Enterococcus dongliensis]